MLVIILYGGTYKWHTRSLKIASLAVLALLSALFLAFPKAISMLSTLTSASAAATALIPAPLERPLRSNLKNNIAKSGVYNLRFLFRYETCYYMTMKE